MLALFIVEAILRTVAMGGIARYLRDRMCKLDVLIIILDLVGILLGQLAVETSGGGDSGGSSQLQMVKTLRVLRFARLFRLQRVLVQKGKQIHAARTRRRKDLTYKVHTTAA